jgi:peptide/nickel transport system substrate-binding protein
LRRNPRSARRFARFGAVLAAAAAAVLACGRGGTFSRERVLTLAVRADVTGIFPNPPTINESFTLDVNSNVFEGLVRLDRNLNAEPAIAERWENPDERTFIFSLKKGLKFSNGEPVTAADVAASLTAAIERPFVTRDTLQAIESVEALGADRVKVRTRSPYPVLLAHLPRGFILPASALKQNPVPPIGTGPYKVDHHAPGQELILVRNTSYRGPAPAFDRVRFLVRPGAKERIDALLSGEAQLADNVPLNEVDRLSTQAGIRVLSRPGLRVLFLAFWMPDGPFHDARVREAVDLALDREELIRRALGGKAVPASQLVPPAVAGFDPSIPFTKPDRERARKLLAEAGYPSGFRVRLDGPNNRYVNDAEILREVSRQLSQVGIAVEVNAVPKADFFPLVLSHKSRFYLLGWACETGEAGDALDALVHTPSHGLLGIQNYQELSDPELDRLIDESNRSALPSTRIALLGQALQRVARLRPLLPIEIQTEAIALSKDIKWEAPLSFALRVYDMSPQ